MGDISLLKGPETPIEMKVFHGGGLIVPVTPDNTTLPQPMKDIPLHEFKGGGLKKEGYVPSREGPRTVSLLHEPEKPAKMKIFKGGARKIFDETSIAPFRGVTVKEIPEDLKKFSFILQILSETESNQGAVIDYNGIPVLPVVISNDKLFFLKGQQIHGQNPDQFFIFNEKGNILNYTDIKGKPTTNFLLFFTKANVDVFTPVFEASETLLTQTEKEIINLSHETKKPLSDEHIGKTILSSGFRVRYVKGSLKEEIKNLRLTESEEELFKTIFRKQSDYVKRWINKSDLNKESFFEFWKLYVNKDGGSYRFLTSREYQTIQGFLLKVLEEYRKELQERALTYLRGFEYDISPTGPIEGPTGPLVSPTGPIEGPTGPIVSPTGPIVSPTGPMAGPTGPMAGPTGPIVSPTGPMAGPTGPIVSPTGPIVSPSGPLVSPTGPMAGPTGPAEEKLKLEENIKSNIGSMGKVTRSITDKLKQATIEDLKILKEKLEKEIANPSMSGTTKPSYSAAIKGTILEVKRGGSRKKNFKIVSTNRFHTSRKVRSKQKD